MVVVGGRERLGGNCCSCTLHSWAGLLGGGGNGRWRHVLPVLCFVAFKASGRESSRPYIPGTGEVGIQSRNLQVFFSLMAEIGILGKWSYYDNPLSRPFFEPLCKQHFFFFLNPWGGSSQIPYYAKSNFAKVA